MTKNVLLVGLEYAGPDLIEINIETLGLCRPEIDETHAAYALYEYDLIIINPASYSHFIFGKSGEFSDSTSELSDLKRKNNSYDLDTIFNPRDRSKELKAAFNSGARIIWLLTDEKRESFFGLRKTHCGYINNEVENIVTNGEIYQKKSRQMTIENPEHKLAGYFMQIKNDSWRYCIDPPPGAYTSIASTPEGYSLGLEVKVGEHIGWLLTPPRTEEAISKLIKCALELDESDITNEKYEGIFLSNCP